MWKAKIIKSVTTDIEQPRYKQRGFFNPRLLVLGFLTVINLRIWVYLYFITLIPCYMFLLFNILIKSMLQYAELF